MIKCEWVVFGLLKINCVDGWLKCDLNVGVLFMC